MGAQSLEIIRQGIWASLTGGWYYDPHQNIFCNTFHLYLWLYLAILPLLIYLYTSTFWLPCICHLVALGLISVTIKSINYALHYTFDNGECHEEEIPPETPSSDPSKPSIHNLSFSRQQSCPIDELPLQIVSNSRLEDNTPPVGCSSHNSVIEATQPDTPQQNLSTIDLKVDVHHKDSSSSEEGATAHRQPDLSACAINIERNEVKFNINKNTGSLSLLKGTALGDTDENNLTKDSYELTSRNSASLDTLQTYYENGFGGCNDSLGNYIFQSKCQEKVNLSEEALHDKLIHRKRVNSARCSPNENSHSPTSPSRSVKGAENVPKSQSSSKRRSKRGKDERKGVPSRQREMPSQRSKSSTMDEVDAVRLKKFNCGDLDTDEDGTERDSSSLLAKEDISKNFSSPRRSKAGARTLNYHPLVYKDAKESYPTSSDNDNVRVTTLTFENIYADDGSSSDSPQKVSSSDEGESKSFAPTFSEFEASSQSHLSSKAADNKKLPDVASVSSCSSPDIDWLFCHSESDSEFANVPTDDYAKDSPVAQKEEPGAGEPYKLNLRDPEGLAKQGAIPKQRRQGLIVSEIEEPAGAAGSSREVTMDLLRKMLEVFNSYPGNSPGDFKKLLFLVSLEQEGNPTIVDTVPVRDRYRISAHGQSITLTSITEDQINNASSAEMASTSRLLHRKPAVRRRRPTPESSVDADEDQGKRRPTSQKEPMGPIAGEEGAVGESMPYDVSQEKETDERSTNVCKISPYPSGELDLEAMHAAVHIAKTHDDTSDGAMHCFQDELGHWFTYTFKNSGMETPSAIVPLYNHAALKRLIRTARATLHQANQKPEKSSGEGDSLSSSSMSLCSTVMLDGRTAGHSPVATPYQEAQSSKDHVIESPHEPLSRTRSSPFFLRDPNWSRAREMDLPARRRGDHGVRPPTAPYRGGRDTPVPSGYSSQFHTGLEVLNLGAPSNPFHLFTSAFFDRRRRQRAAQQVGLSDTFDPCLPGSDVDFLRMDNLGMMDNPKLSTAPKTVQYYNLELFGRKIIKIKFDRLSLLSLLDRNISFKENVCTVVLILVVSTLGLAVFSRGHYREIGALWFSLVIGSCQYCLFKSVQPDASSPTHGYNHIILFSRPIYFCLCCIIIIFCDLYLDNGGANTFALYGITLSSPVIISVVNTFFMYLLEQIDIHIFGGNATTSLSSSAYCVGRSILAVLFLLGFAYGSLNSTDGSNHVLYSIFCSLLVAVSYHLSRSASNPSVVWELMKQYVWPEEWKKTKEKDEVSSDCFDPLPLKLRTTVMGRLTQDFLVCTTLALLVAAVHSSGVFTILLMDQSTDLIRSFWIIAVVLGLSNHYFIPALRTQQPWRCFSRPACVTHEYSQFEVYNSARIMWFERLYVWLCLFEKNVVYLIIFLCALTKDANLILEKHPILGPLMVVVSGLKCLRNAYSHPQYQYLILSFTTLFFNYDLKDRSESFLVDYFFMSIIFNKFVEFMLKLKFIITYIAPWQITWGSALHAFAQPFSVPHSAMLFVQAAISSLLSTPLNPLLGSAIFITSYVRPIKFWERDYNTKRMDHSNTRLSSLLEQNPGADDNNLNSIFYEHLTRSLQHSLCGDLLIGHWGPYSQGDCFVLASDNLNCLVHIIEVGNGLVTFQVRGLEFRGTYCQQREVEAISEGVDEDGGCCCCDPGHIPFMLSANAAFNQRWLAWEVTATKYVLEGYSISDNSASSMFQMFELRRILVTYYVKSIIYFTVNSPELPKWLRNEEIATSLAPLLGKNFADLDPTFHSKVDEDYDCKESGITRLTFCKVYLDWLVFCLQNRKTKDDGVPLVVTKDSPILLLCFALSLLGRRALGPSNQCENVDVFLSFLHSLFKGDIRPTCIRDEWVFADMELLKKVVAPALRMSLKLHQDHFLVPGEYEINESLYSAINEHKIRLVICHEADPAWRSAILMGRPSLLSLRHVNDDGEDKFKIIMLNKRHLLFRVIKVNKECVRGLWAGQQQELVFFRNRNPERGSIQNAKQALRNIINSSCDQPIGYPIYVSPLTTSYVDTHEQYSTLTSNTITPRMIKLAAINLWRRVRDRCLEGCSIGGSAFNDECRRSCDVCRVPHSQNQTGSQLQQVLSTTPVNLDPTQRLSSHLSRSPSAQLSGRSARTSGMLRGASMSVLSAPASKSSSTFVSLAGLLEDASVSSLGRLERRLANLEEQASAAEYLARDKFFGQKTDGHQGRELRANRRKRDSRERSEPIFEHEELQLDVIHAKTTDDNINIDQLDVASSQPYNSGVSDSRPTTNADQSMIDSSSLSIDDDNATNVTESTLCPMDTPSTSMQSSDFDKQHNLPPYVKITDANQVYDKLNLGRKIDVTWPDENMQIRGGQNFWGNWVPLEGMIGQVVHMWVPHHKDPKYRSNVDKVIYLVKIHDKFVPVAKGAVEIV